MGADTEPMPSRNAHRSEAGFTLIELLVVILVIGILAAIAVSSLLGHRAKANDSAAKSDARTLVTAMEACYTESQRYDTCPGNDHGVQIGTGRGESTAAGAGDGYTIDAYSRSGNTFTIVKNPDQTVERTCSDAGSKQGGCNGGSW